MKIQCAQETKNKNENKIIKKKIRCSGTALATHWLRVYTPHMVSLGSIPAWGTRYDMLQTKDPAGCKEDGSFQVLQL